MVACLIQSAIGAGAGWGIDTEVRQVEYKTTYPVMCVWLSANIHTYPHLSALIRPYPYFSLLGRTSAYESKV